MQNTQKENKSNSYNRMVRKREGERDKVKTCKIIILIRKMKEKEVMMYKESKTDS